MAGVGGEVCIILPTTIHSLSASPTLPSGIDIWKMLSCLCLFLDINSFWSLKKSTLQGHTMIYPWTWCWSSVDTDSNFALWVKVTLFLITIKSTELESRRPSLLALLCGPQRLSQLLWDSVSYPPKERSELGNSLISFWLLKSKSMVWGGKRQQMWESNYILGKKIKQLQQNL